MKYSFYKTVSSDYKKGLRNAVKKRGGNWQSVWLENMISDKRQGDIGACLMLEDAYADRPQVYAPIDSRLVNQLCSLKLSGVIESLRTPSPIFSIALPEKSEVSNRKLDGILVAYVAHEEIVEAVRSFNNKFGGNLNIDEDLNAPKYFDGKKLILFYTWPGTKGIKSAQASLIADSDDINAVIASNNPDALSADTPSQSIFTKDSNDEELAFQFDVLKFTVSFIIYMSTHEDKVSKVGVFSGESINKGDINKYSLSVIPGFKENNGITPHYRNLRHERFYRGEWESWEVGTRWIPVGMDLHEAS